MLHTMTGCYWQGAMQLAGNAARSLQCFSANSANNIRLLEKKIDRKTVDNIPEKTERYPQSFIHNKEISFMIIFKMYLHKI